MNAVERFRKRRSNRMKIRMDEEVWRTTDRGKHYAIERETGEITKGNIGQNKKAIGGSGRITREQLPEYLKKYDGNLWSEPYKRLREKGGALIHVPNSTIDNIDPNVIKIAADTVGEVGERFPGVGAMVNICNEEDDIYDSEALAALTPYSGLDTFTLNLGKEMFGSIEEDQKYKDHIYLRQGFRKNIKSKEDWVKSEIAHEIGHLLECACARELGYQKNLTQKETIDYLQRDAFVKRFFINRAKQDIGVDLTQFKNMSEIGDAISNYGAKYPRELFAECFADYWINGEKAHPLSKAFAGHIKKMLGDQENSLWKKNRSEGKSRFRKSWE